MRTSTASAPGEFQLMVVVPRAAAPVTGMGFGFAVRVELPMEGHGALIEVTQVLPTKSLAPGVAKFCMSKPAGAEAWSTEASTPGFPMMKFFRMRFPAAPGNRIIPFAFPTTMFSSMILSVAVAPPGVPMPKLLPGVENPFPLIRFARSRLRLAPPASHIPPHAAVGCAFRTETLFSSRLLDPLTT